MRVILLFIFVLSILFENCLIFYVQHCVFASKGKKVVTSGLGVIGDIGKKTYSILLEDEDSNTARKTKVSILSVLCTIYVWFILFF